jgi:hypothetical protein
MGRLGRFVVRRRRTLILAGVALLVVTATNGRSPFSVLSTDFGAGTTTESGRVSQQLDDLAETGGQIAIVADGIEVDDPQVQKAVTAGLAEIAALDGVLDVADPWSTGVDALRGSSPPCRGPSPTAASIASPAGCSSDRCWSEARSRWCSSCSASRFSAPDSRTVTPARCPAPRKSGPPT